jgi:hypothetical protein
MFTPLTKTLAIIFSLNTALGILVHDTRIDKAATTAVALPVVVASYELNNQLGGLMGDSHTHVERSMVARVTNDFTGRTPQINPRFEDKRYSLPKSVSKGHHAFDNYNLPIV